MTNTCHLCDCNDFMAGLPDNAFDLAIVDPEYGTDTGNMNLGFSNSSNIIKSDWDKKPPSPEYFIELFRISKNQIIFGSNYFNLPPHKGFIVWDKGPGMRGRSFAGCEQAYCSIGNAKIFELAPNNLKDKKIHKAQKPVALYKWLLTNYAKPGWTIFDSHVGSGSIRIACHDLGFDFTGCELDPDYHAAQEKRYQDHIEQGDLIPPEEIQETAYEQHEL